jgi:hypothetical protein
MSSAPHRSPSRTKVAGVPDTARASTGARKRALFYDQKLTARGFAATAPRPPTCGSR